MINIVYGNKDTTNRIILGYGIKINPPQGGF
jgi:hypothetical protein